MSDDIITTKQAMDAYLQPAIEQMEQKHAMYRDKISAEVAAIMGEHTCKEIIEGVWEHTFTPARPTPESWLEEYDRYSRASILRAIEEMSKPMYDTPYMRYLAWQPQIVIPSTMPMPYLAEGASTEAWSMHVANATPIRKWQRKVKARKRTRRQHRAAFRRRKRGLA